MLKKWSKAYKRSYNAKKKKKEGSLMCNKHPCNITKSAPLKPTPLQLAYEIDQTLITTC